MSERGADIDAESLGAGLDFRRIFESVPGLFLVLEPEPAFRILAATDAYLHVLHAERGAILGRSLLELFADPPAPGAAGPRELRESLERVLARRAADTMAVQQYDVRVPQGEGAGLEERFWGPVHAPVLGPEGELRCIVHRVDRASSAGELERARDEQGRQLEQANRELESFCYSVSHDLRAPLRAIDGFGRALLADCGERLGPEGRHYLDRVRAGAQRMGAMIDDLLAFSRLAGAPLRRVRVDLSALADEIVAELRQRDPERSVRVSIACGLVAWADRRLLSVLLANLLGNAWKFSARSADACIGLGRQRSGSEEVFSVTDNGAGFDMAFAGRLFTPFSRLHPESEYPGTGIGLASVRRIAARHGGRVWAQGQVGAGATFFFTLGGVAR